MKKEISIILYIVGIFMVIYFVAKAFIGGNTVLNPEAMIPFTEFERNCIFLGLGFIPMILSCVYLIRTLDIKARVKRTLVFIPGFITAIPFVYGVGLIVIMMFLGLRDVINVLFLLLNLLNFQ